MTLEELASLPCECVGSDDEFIEVCDPCKARALMSREARERKEAESWGQWAENLSPILEEGS